jgi:hypothetical protein
MGFRYESIESLLETQATVQGFSYEVVMKEH